MRFLENPQERNGITPPRPIAIATPAQQSSIVLVVRITMMALVIMFCLSLTLMSYGQEPAAPVLPAAVTGTPGTELPALPLSSTKTQLLKDYERFEKSLFDVAEQVRRKDPERAELLYRARTQSQEQNILSEMRSISELLRDKNANGGSVSPQFGPAAERQTEVVARLEGVLKILQSLDDRERVAAEIQRVQDLLKDTNRILAKQKDARAETQRRRAPERAIASQKQVNDEAQKLAERIEQHDAERQAQRQSQQSGQPTGQQPGQEPGQQGPSGQSPPGSSEQSPPSSGGQQGQEGTSQSGQSESQSAGRQQLEQARKEMQQAIEDLQKSLIEDALTSQDDAVRKLEEMKAELEEILRQLREDERESNLTLLEARFQNMLRRQQNINKETIRLFAIPDPDKPRQNYGSQVEILRKDQDDNAVEAAKALHLLKEDGSSVAFPEAVEQMHQNMLVIVARLARQETGQTTQLVEQLVVETLEEMIAALRKEIDKAKEEKKGAPGEGGIQGGGQNQSALVEQIAELKMIRSLQNQINRLTRQVGDDLQGKLPQTPDQEQLIRDLRLRQDRIQQATYDLSVGRNE